MGADEFQEFRTLMLELKQDLKRHMEVEEIQMRNHINVMNEMRNDIKELKSAQTADMLKVQEHIEAKINSCNAKIFDTLEHKYMTAPAIEAYAGKVVAEQQKERNEAINGLRKRLEHETDEKVNNLESKAKLIAWVAGTVMGVVTTAIGIAISAAKLFN